MEKWAAHNHRNEIRGITESDELVFIVNTQSRAADKLWGNTVANTAEITE